MLPNSAGEQQNKLLNMSKRVSLFTLLSAHGKADSAADAYSEYPNRHSASNIRQS
jgi:hypothetical protein